MFIHLLVYLSNTKTFIVNYCLNNKLRKQVRCIIIHYYYITCSNNICIILISNVIKCNILYCYYITLHVIKL
jgi:hypothetical protein